MSFRIPIDAGQYTQTQGFGENAEYYAQYGQNGHNGRDLGANLGTPVHAADDGTVAFEGWGQNHPWMLSPAGICIIINHGGCYAGYAHLNETIVSAGDQVSKGQVVGYVGATGAATGPHLHFEMLPLNPDFRNGFAGRIDMTPYLEDTQAAEAAAAQAAEEARRAEEARAAEAARAAAEQQAAEAKKAADIAAAAAAQAAAQLELDRIAAAEAAAKEAAERKAKEQADIAAQADRRGDIAIDQETKQNVSAILKIVTSIKMMLVNFIGWVKNILKK